MQVSRRAEPRYWLDYEQDPGVELLKLDMKELPNDFRQRILPCPELGFFSAKEPEPAADAVEIASGPEPASEDGADVVHGDDDG